MSTNYSRNSQSTVQFAQYPGLNHRLASKDFRKNSEDSDEFAGMPTLENFKIEPAPVLTGAGNMFTKASQGIDKVFFLPEMCALKLYLELEKFFQSKIQHV